MPDLRDFNRELGPGIVPPDFDEIVRTSRKRRRAGAATAIVATATVLTVTAIGLQQASDENTAPTPPAVTTGQPDRTDSSPDSGGLTAEQIVHHPEALMTSVAISPTDPDVRATAWSVCTTKPRRCANTGDGYVIALAVTADGFKSAHYLEFPDPDLARIPWASVVAIDEGEFLWSSVLHDNGEAQGPSAIPWGDFAWIVTTDGEIRKASVSFDSPVLGASERLETCGVHACAVNPSTGHTLRLENPLVNGMVQSPDGLVYGIANADDYPEITEGDVVWSTDGGANWQSRQVAVPPPPLEAVRTGVDGQLVVAEGSDVASSFALHVSHDQGQTWQRIRPPWAAATPPDSRRLVTRAGTLILAYADPKDSTGSWFHRATGPEWSRLEAAQTSTTSAAALDPGPFLMRSGLDTDGSEILYAGNYRAVFLSTDDGRTWAEARSR